LQALLAEILEAATPAALEEYRPLFVAPGSDAYGADRDLDNELQARGPFMRIHFDVLMKVRGQLSNV
jgi:glycerol-3-phosphate cytidylyltransferase-like family protein